MEAERQTVEYKSIQKIRTGDKGYKDLAVTCVAFANARGGTIFIGYDDKTAAPPTGQTVDIGEMNATVSRLRSLTDNVLLTLSDMQRNDLGAEYFVIYVAPTFNGLASTSDGRFYIRIGDECVPVKSEDIIHLASERQSIQWELQSSRQVRLSDLPQSCLASFADKIRNSNRVSPHIKQMTDVEIAESYNLITHDGHLTYLGVLWLGSAYQRSALPYPITVQYIVYDSLERKIRKRDWHDNILNPAELLLDIEQEATELKYFYEFPDGLFRKQVYHYHPKVVRELLLNAFAHKSFTISGDIMIEVYPDRMEITNPGGLPLGVTKDNILHSCHRRNPHFIRIMHDMNLMEGEGSGYDLIYEYSACDSKCLPEIESTFNYTKVVQRAEITNAEIIPFLDYVINNYSLTQKNIIALGLVARHQKMLSTELSRILQLTDTERLRNYMDRLLTQGILITRGRKKGNEFLINPRLIANARLNLKTTLKTIEPHRLEALIKEDLRLHPHSSINEIAERLPDVEMRDIRKFVYSLARNGVLLREGGKMKRTYSVLD